MGDVYDRRSGERVELAPGDVEIGVLEGRLAVSGDMPALAPDGRVGRVAASGIADALRAGYKLISPEDHHARILAREEGDAASLALGAAETLGNTLTFGGLAQGQRLAGVDMERARARREGLGTAGTAIEVAGSVLPAISTGGGSLVARGLLSGGRAVQGLSRAAGRGVAGALGTGSRLARAVPVAVRGAVEGAAYGVGTEITEAALGDRDLAAEKLAAAGLIGGLFGGAVDVAGHAALRGISSGARMAKDKVSEVLARSGDTSLADALGKRIAKPLSDAQAFATSGPRQLYRGILEDLGTSEGRKATMLGARHTAEVREQAARKIQDAYSAFQKADDDVHKFVGSEMKVKEQANRVPVELRKVAVVRTKEQLSGIRDELRAMIDSGAASKQTLTRIYGLADDALRKVQRSGKHMTALREADKLKRDMYKAQGQMKALMSDDAESRRAVQGMSGKLRGFLEDESVWGHAGRSQRDLNAAISRQLQSTKEVPRAFRQGQLDSQAALTMARKIGRFAGETSEDAILRNSSDKIATLAEMERFYKLSPEMAANVKAAREAHEKLLQTMRETESIVRKSDDLLAARGYEGEGSPSIGVASSIGGIAGYALGGVPGAFIGTAVTRPYTTARVLAGMLESIDRLGKRKSESVSRLGSMGEKAVRAMVAAGSVAGKAARVGARTALTRRDPEKVDAKRMASSPDAVMARMAPVTGLMQGHAPEVASSLVQVAQRAATYLASIDPRPPANPYTGRTPPPTPDALDRWERGVRVVTDPLGVLDRVADGSVSIEDGEALRAVYPKVYEEMRGDIMARMAERASAGRPVQYDQRLRVGLVFQMPTDPVIDPALAGVLQVSSPDKNDAQLSKGRGGDPLSSNTKTGIEEIQNGL